jgi:hypothetical protein
MLKGGAGYIRSSTVVFEETGFRAAAVRGIVASLIMLSRVPFPHRVFASVAAAMDWQLELLRAIAPDLGREELVGAIEALRSRRPLGARAFPSSSVA